MLQRLRNEQPVERVAVERLQARQVWHRSFVDRQAGNSMCVPPLWEVVSGRSREWELAELVFDNSFPDRGDAQIYLVGFILAGLPKNGRELRISGDVPKEYVCIEQQPHRPSNSRKTSSGSGASKSSGTVNSPAHRPNWRGPVWVAGRGRNSATGWPPRITTKRSPASTRSSRASGSRWSSLRLTVLIAPSYQIDRGLPVDTHPPPAPPCAIPAATRSPSSPPTLKPLPPW